MRKMGVMLGEPKCTAGIQGCFLTGCSLLFLPHFYSIFFFFYVFVISVHVDWDCRRWDDKCVLWLQPWYVAVSLCITQFFMLLLNLKILGHSSRLDKLISSWIIMIVLVIEFLEEWIYVLLLWYGYTFSYFLMV